MRAAPLPRDAGDAGERAWPSEAYGWYVTFVLCACGIVAFVDRQIINLLVEDIKADLRISDTQISLLQGAWRSLFYAIAAVPLGRLADTGNRRRVIMAGIRCVFGRAGGRDAGLAKSFWQLFVARTFVGVAEATLTPSGFSMLGDLFRLQRLSLPLGVFTGSSFFGLRRAADRRLRDLAAFLARAGDAAAGRRAATLEAAFVIGALPGVVVALLFFPAVRAGGAMHLTQPVARDADQPDALGALGFVRDNARVFSRCSAACRCWQPRSSPFGAWVPAYFIPQPAGRRRRRPAMAWCSLFRGTGGGRRRLAVGLLPAAWPGATGTCAHRTGLGAGDRAVRDRLPVAPSIVALSLRRSRAQYSSAPWLSAQALPQILVICPARMRAVGRARLLVANLVGQTGGPWIVAVFTDYVFGARSS